jgi:hypothetical protein
MATSISLNSTHLFRKKSVCVCFALSNSLLSAGDMSWELSSDGPLNELITATIAGTESVDEGGYTLYAIQVTSKTDGSVWTVYRRFSNFLNLQSRLPKGTIPVECGVHGGVLASSTAPEIVQRRTEMLEDFLNALLSLPATTVWANEDVCEFLRLPAESPSEEPHESFLLNETLQSWPPTSEPETYIDLKSLTVSVNKMNEESLNKFLLDLMHQVGGGTGPIPTASSVHALGKLEHLVSETNVDGAIIVHAMVHIPGWQSIIRLPVFIRTPTYARSRLSAFKVVKAVLTNHSAQISTNHILLNDEQAISQYTAWISPTNVLSPQTPGSNSVSYFMGPQSPLARSVYASNSGMGGHAVATAALEAREWVASAAGDSGFRLPGLVSSGSEWTRVAIPNESVKRINGQLDLKYRVQASGSGVNALMYEIRLHWNFMPSDSSLILNSLWDLLSEGGTGIPVPGEAANLTETVECRVRDLRQVGGIVTINLVKSCMRSFNGRVVMAATTDPSANTGNENRPAGQRHIKHLHYVGFEVDADRGNLTGCALLSSESIFLVAGDLLGERLSLWQTIERFSSIATSLSSSVPEKVVDTPMDEWLRMSSILIG